MEGDSGTSSRREIKMLVAYFSHSGNTRVVAGQIRDIVGGDTFEIVAVDPYPADYDEAVERARKELDGKCRPKLKTRVKSMESYDVVFIGYPNWWGTIPMPVASFLSDYDFSRKTIAPYCTHEGSRLGRSVEHITELCPKSIVRDGLAIRGRDVKNVRKEVAEWLRRIGTSE